MSLDLTMPILVVDDYRTMLRITCDLLGELGFRDVDEARDVAAAMQRCWDKRYRLVISDWRMAPLTAPTFCAGFARRRAARIRAFSC
jgi:two-component system chemotaxis response regulator CheY